MSTVDESNCSLVPLSVKDLVQDMTPYGLAILVIESLIVLVSLIIYFEAYFFIKTILAREPTGRKSVFVLGLYPVFITLSYMSVLIPRTSTVTMPAASMYLSVVLHRLISIQADYFGGRRNYIEIITGQEVSLASFPFCICPCLPVMTMDAKHVKIIECGIMQHAVLRPLFYYIILIIESATYIYPTKYDSNLPYVYLYVAINISTIYAMFNIGLMKSMVGDHLKDCKITPKFICIRLVLITTILQETLLSFLGTFGVIACRKSGPLANQSRTLWLNHNLLIFEMFFLLLWARHLYRTQEGNMYGIVPPSQIYRKIRQNERLNKRESLTADYRKANERTPLLSDIFEQA